jgi:ABC-type molybdate transport system substrate-binding protein
VNVAPNAPYGLAGMESLYVSAVEYYSENPRHAFGATPAAEACREIDFMTGSGAALDNFSTTSPTSGGKNGGGNYSDPTLPIIFGDNVTFTQDTVIAGTSQIALLPKSFVVSPAGNDTNFWAVVPECGVTSGQRATVLNGWTAKISGPEACSDQDYVKGMHDNSAAKISSRDFGRNGTDSPFTLVGEHGFYSPIRQWVVVENDDQDQSATADLSTRDGMAASAFIQYLLSAKGQAVLISFGYDPIS